MLHMERIISVLILHLNIKGTTYHGVRLILFVFSVPKLLITFNTFEEIYLINLNYLQIHETMYVQRGHYLETFKMKTYYPNFANKIFLVSSLE